MKLSEMTREQLEKTAKKYGVDVYAGMSDVKIRNVIRKLKKPKSSVESWPKDWSEDVCKQFYLKVMHEELKELTVHTWTRFQEEVAVEAAKIQPRVLVNGDLDCKGLHYGADAKFCNALCVDMPVCKWACEHRTEIKVEADALQVEVAKVGEKHYSFAGDIKSLKKEIAKETDSDSDMLAVYDWITAQKNFTVVQLREQCAVRFKGAKKLAQEIVDYLFSNGDIVEQV